MTTAPPSWWVERERAFAQFLRQPLAHEGGRLRANLAHAKMLRAVVVDGGKGAGIGASVGVDARLALHHEQYWMRLFVVVQEHLPRVCRVVGPFALNTLSMAALVAAPAAATLDDVGVVVADALRADLDALVDGAGRGQGQLVTMSLTTLSGQGLLHRDGTRRAPGGVGAILAALDVPWSMLSQALAQDIAHRRGLEERLTPPWQPSDDELDAVRAGRVMIQPAPSLSILRSDWADVAVIDGSASATMANAGTAPQPSPPPAQVLPTRLKAPIHRVVWRVDEGVAVAEVDVVTARLLARFAREAYGDVVAHVVERFPAGAADWLERTFETFARNAASRGWWIGTRPTHTGQTAP